MQPKLCYNVMSISRWSRLQLSLISLLLLCMAMSSVSQQSLSEPQAERGEIVWNETQELLDIIPLGIKVAQAGPSLAVPMRAAFACDESFAVPKATNNNILGIVSC